MKAAEKQQLAKVQKRLDSGELADQKCWSFIRELNSYSEERLESIAIHDSYRTYTYRQMFRYWERYAEAFSGVNLTGKNHSRVALIGAQQTETIFAFYALNMTGASVSLIYHLDLYDEKRIRTMIEREKITDLVISEVYAFPNVMKKLLREKEVLGLRNIILLESPMGGEYPIPPLEAVRKLNVAMFRELEGGLLMADLLKEYEGNTEKLWESNIFGKSLFELVSEGLGTKLSRMPEDARMKMRNTIGRIINEGSGGLICIIL